MGNNKEIFIIQAPEYNWDYFGLFCDPIQDHFKRILKHLKICTSDNNSVEIKLKVDVLNPEQIRACATRISTNPYLYEIILYPGISYPLWTVSRTFSLPEYDILPWVNECQINDERLKSNSVKDILSNYAFSLGCYYILLHEISHIVLGHIDYLNDRMSTNQLDEFQDEKKEYSSMESKIIKALEAEADRQAGEWLIGFFENSLGDNGLGGYLLFPSRIHAYEFYVHAITSVFRLMQDLTQRESVTHPKPNERLHILIDCISTYFKQNIPHEHDEIVGSVSKSRSEAGKRFFVVDSFDPTIIKRNQYNLAFVNDVIKEINIRDFQHKVELVD